MSKFAPVKYKENGICLEVYGVLFEADSPEEAIRHYRNGRTVFWNNWRGSFWGVLKDEPNDITLLFNDHIGSRVVFYAQGEERCSYGTDLKALSQATGLHCPNEIFIRAIIEKGYLGDNSTVYQGINRLLAGQYLLIRGKEVRLASYHRFTNTPYPYQEAKMLAETDRLFRQAVARVIRKNEQEGLNHFFPLSGGLDSRMCQIVAHNIAKQPITNYTYSQTGHYDHLLPREISNFMGNNWQFMALDGGDYLSQVDKISSATQWLINYNGPSEIYEFASHQDWNDKGIVLTGVNGDNILSVITDGKHEMELLYSLSFSGNGLGSPQVLQHYTESYSPFCDVDFLEYVLHIPAAKRRNYAFYDKWIMTYYPEATRWLHKHEPIGHRHRMVTIAGRNIFLRDLPKRIVWSVLKRLHIYDGYKIDEDSMNPYDRWAKSNPKLLPALDAYFEAHKKVLKGLSCEQELLQRYQSGNITEKCAVLTIVSALRP